MIHLEDIRFYPKNNWASIRVGDDESEKIVLITSYKSKYFNFSLAEYKKVEQVWTLEWCPLVKEHYNIWPKKISNKEMMKIKLKS